MGERTVAQEALFYEFILERHVPAHHLLPLTASSISYDWAVALELKVSDAALKICRAISAK
jgi:hypothetical protein